MVPSHGNHAGPNRSSNDPPVSDTDAVAQLHDKCYDKASSRDDELGCDAQAYHYAQNAIADGPYEAMYLGAMKHAFHPDRTGKSAPEDAPGFSNELIEYVPLPQRIPRNRKVQKQIQKIEKEEARIEKAVEKIELAAEQPLPVLNTPEKQAAVHKRQRNFTAAKKLKRERKKLRRQKKALKKKVRMPAKRKGRAGPKRKFKTVRGMGNQSFVGNAIVAQNRAGAAWHISPFKHKKVKQGGGIVIKARDLLTKITASGQVDNTILFTQILNPLQFTYTRMSQFAPLYQKYRFRRCTFMFEPADGTNTLGAYMHYVDEDPMTDYTPLNGTIRLAQDMATHTGCRQFQVFKPDQTTFRHDTPEATYYMKAVATPVSGGTPSNDARDINQAKYHLAILNAPANGAIGNIWIDYEIEFWGNALNQDVLVSDVQDMDNAIDNDIGIEWNEQWSASDVWSSSWTLDGSKNMFFWFMNYIATKYAGGANILPNVGNADGAYGLLTMPTTTSATNGMLVVRGMACGEIVLTITGKINTINTSSSPVIAVNNDFKPIGIPTNGTVDAARTTGAVRLNGLNLYWSFRAVIVVNDQRLPVVIPFDNATNLFLASGSFGNGQIGTAGFCSLRVSTVQSYVKPPFTMKMMKPAKCPYASAIKESPHDTEAIMELWHPGGACEKATCKACGFARISNSFREQLHREHKKYKEKEKIKFTRLEEHCEDSSDDSDDGHEKTKTKEKRKSLPVKGSF